MSENEDIHCNVLQCRRPLCLETQACVTSCSHIFCVGCANRHFNQALVCPACSTSLTQSDDIVVTQLNPSEEYKSSILAGLRPDVIKDVSSRAIAFYCYQTSQELCYKAIMQQNLETKCQTLQDQLRDAVNDANRSVKAEKQKNNALIREQEQEKRRVHDLQSKLHEKTRQFQKLQTMYEKLKRKTVTPNIQQTLNHQQQQVEQQQQQQPTPVSMVSGLAPTFTIPAASETSRLRTFPYAPSTVRQDSPEGYTESIREETPVAPPQVHHRLQAQQQQQQQQQGFDDGYSSAVLYTQHHNNQQQQQQQYKNQHHHHPPPAAARRNVRNQQQSTVMMAPPGSARHPQQQQPSPPSYFYRDNMVQPPPPAATAQHHQQTRMHQHLVGSTNQQYRPTTAVGNSYATVVSPKARSVATSGGGRRGAGGALATPSPRLRPFTSTNRVSIPQQHRQHHHYQ